MIYEINYLQEVVESFQYLLNKIEEEIKTPDYTDFIAQLHHIDSKQNQLMDEIEDNSKRVNCMLLELKGIISMTRASLKDAKKSRSQIDTDSKT